MSLSEIKIPNLITPVNDIVPYVFNSSFSGTTGFRYKVDIVSSHTVSDNWPTANLSLFVYPDVSNGYCIYDGSRFFMDNTTSDLTLNWNCVEPIKNINSFTIGGFDVTEYIGDVSGDTISDDSDYYYLFRGATQYGKFFNWDGYFPTGSTTKFLTNFRDRTLKLGEWDTTNTFAGIFQSATDPTTTWDRVYIEVFTSSIGQLYYIESNYENPGVPNLITIPVGPANLNQAVADGKVYLHSTSTLIPTGNTIIDSDTVYYEIDLRETPYGSLDAQTETITVTIDTECYRYNGVEFMWVGELGSYESYTFRLKDIKSFKIETETYKKYMNSIISNDLTYNIGDRGYDIFHLETKENHKVTSSWVNDDEINNKIMELYRSPEVYVIIDDEIYPIIITNRNVISKDVKQYKTWKHIITYMMAYDINVNL